MENFIEIDEKKYPIKFTYAALMALERKLKKTFVAISFELGQGSITMMMEITLMGLIKGAKAKDEKFNLKIDELADTISQTELIKAVEFFSDSFGEKEEGDDHETEQKKTE